MQSIVPKMATACRVGIKFYTHSLTLARGGSVFMVQRSAKSLNKSIIPTQCQACVDTGRPGNTSVNKIKTT